MKYLNELQNKYQKLSKRLVIVLIISLILVGAGIFAITQTNKKSKNNSDAELQKKLAEQVREEQQRRQKILTLLTGPVLSPEEAEKNKHAIAVEKLMGNPKKQKMYVYIFEDTEKFRDLGDFFAKAQKGNVLLAYESQTVLYDPTNNVVRDISGMRVLEILETRPSPTPIQKKKK